DYRFKLYADPLGSTQVGSNYSTNAIPATNGLFVTTIDFGAGVFTGSNYWLEVNVKTNGAGGYTVLSPLQGVTPTPNAIFATTAGNVSGTVSAAQLSGAVANGNLPSNPTVSGTVTAGAFTGNGANVTNVNAAALNGLNAANFWQLGGNNVAPGQFLGSTNNQPVEIWANNSRAWRLEPGLNGMGAPNVIGGSPVNYVVGGVVGAVIGGGGATNYGGASYTNSVAADFGTVAGGYQNTIQADATFSMIGGGYWNTIQTDASFSMIPGGYHNQAGGLYSFAAGQQAQALFTGDFVWADSQNAPFASTASDQFLIRARGGVGINTNAPVAALEVASASGSPQIQVDQQNPDYARVRLNALTNSYWDLAAQSELNIYNSSYGNVMTLEKNGMVGIGVNNPGHYLDVGGRIRLRQESGGNSAGIFLYQNTPANDRAFIGMVSDGYVGIWGNAGGNWGLVMNVTNDYIGIGNLTPTHLLQVGNAYCDGNSWSPASDRNLKAGFAPVNAAEILAKVTALPITRWHYTNDVSTAHVGPMAQDFHAAFATGADDQHIADVDEGGVALAAIQGLNQKVESDNAALRAENADLKARLERLEQFINNRTGGGK